MPSKLRKAIGAVKDRTSIGLARVSRAASQLDLLVLKATTHNEHPADDRHVAAILALASSSRADAAACVASISRRISRTRDWAVALKCLHLVSRALRDGGPFFPREVLSAMRRGSRLLNLSGFRDESGRKDAWDYTTFVRSIALYLDERLDCILLGKLQGDDRPAVVLDRIGYWQTLLDRVVTARPTGPSRNNELVQASLYAVVRESFDVYRNAADGVKVLLDAFFKMDRRWCVEAYHACVRASKQAEELAGFYEACQSVGVGRRAEYPHVEKVTPDVLRSMHDFIRDSRDLNKPKAPFEVVLLTPPPSAEAKLQVHARQVFDERPKSEEDWQIVLMETASGMAREGLLERCLTKAEVKNPFLEEVGTESWAEPTFRATTEEELERRRRLEEERREWLERQERIIARMNVGV